MERFFQCIRLTALTLMLCVAFSLSAAAKKKMVERGMDRQEVRAILGKPEATSFDEYGETWSYYKIDYLNKLILVHFDLDGKVNTYQEQLYERMPGGGTPSAYAPRPLMSPDNYYLPSPSCSMSDQAFSILLDKVRSASFDKDKYNLLEVASLGCHYTCDQCARMMGLFSFTDDKLHVLRIMAPRIVDARNALVIYNVFTFDSDKEKAAQIIAGK